MIKGVAGVNENPHDNPPAEDSAEPVASLQPGAEQPSVLVPMSSEDFDRDRRRTRSLVIVAALVAIVAAAWIYKRSTDPVRARESFDAGERLFKVARYPQAILSFDRAISLSPGYADAYLLRARARVGINDLERAIVDFTAVIRLRPNDPQPYVERGAAYLEFKNYPASMDDCLKAIELDPKLAPAYNLRGTLLRTKGDARKALEDFTRAVEISPDLANYYQRGATYQLLGEHKKALADFDQAILFSPFSAQAYFSRAESKRALGDAEGARKDHLQGRILDSR